MTLLLRSSFDFGFAIVIFFFLADNTNTRVFRLCLSDWIECLRWWWIEEEGIYDTRYGVRQNLRFLSFLPPPLLEAVCTRVSLHLSVPDLREFPQHVYMREFVYSKSLSSFLFELLRSSEAVRERERERGPIRHRSIPLLFKERRYFCQEHQHQKRIESFEERVVSARV